MSLITIKIDDVGQYVGWLLQACRDRYLRLNDSIGIKFSGDPWPKAVWQTNCCVITWEDGAAIDLPGIADPTIERIVVFPKEAQIELRYAPDVRIVFDD